jgi:hypothetical protein
MFMVVGTLFLGTDSSGGISSAVEQTPQRNDFLTWNRDILSLVLSFCVAGVEISADNFLSAAVGARNLVGIGLYGAFPDCGPLAEDSAAKLKKSQLIVCTVNSTMYSFPPLWLKLVEDWPVISVST